MKLPEAEYLVMKALWDAGSKATTNNIISNLEQPNTWKAPTVITMLKRLASKGFLRTEKPGKERVYHALVSREDYINEETQTFVEKYHKSSIVNMISSFAQNHSLNHDEIDDLIKWAKEQQKDD